MLLLIHLACNEPSKSPPPRSVSAQLDRGADETVDKLVSRTFDERGNELVEASDYDADGDVDARETSTWDGERLLTVDNGDFLMAFSYDTHGNRTRTEILSGNNNELLSVDTMTYDAEGHQLSLEEDLDADGIIDHVHTYSYNVEGNLEHFQRDDDLSVAYAWEDGLHVSTEWDEQIDGSIDRRYTYFYRAGALEELNADSEADGIIDYRVTYGWEGGLLISELWDDGADGAVETAYEYAYGVDGDLLVEEYDVGADGVIDERWTWTRDAQGNPLTEDREELGVLQERTTWTYACDWKELLDL